jgi:hypothetical protein
MQSSLLEVLEAGVQQVLKYTKTFAEAALTDTGQ